MATKLAMKDDDRDLVVMRHEFSIEDEKNDHQWEITSTMVASGESKAQKGHSIMSKTVGYTCGIATRMVLVGKITRKGVLSPIHEDIYQPILDELETFADAITTNTTPIVTLRDGTNALRVAHQIIECF